MFLTNSSDSGVWGKCRGHIFVGSSYWEIVSLGYLAYISHDQ